MKRLVNQRPSRGAALLLAALPFIVLFALYLQASAERHLENPEDRLLPGISQLVAGVNQVAFEEDRRTGEVILWVDTLASLERLAWGVGVSALFGIVFGTLAGMLPLARAPLSPFVSVLSLVPPMAILPILFIVFGLDELSKIVLIVLGVAPFIIRDIQSRVLEIPVEQLVKAQSLGMSSWQIALRVVLPQVTPRLVDSVRLSLGSAWIFLISAEAIAAEQGLGYRIFLVRRYMAMDVILPYVAWITLLAFVMDRLLAWGNRRAFGWLYTGRKAEEGA